MRRFLTALVALFVPRPLKPCLLNALGHRVACGARIGWGLLLVDRLHLEKGARIGSFNWISCRRLLMRKGAYFGRFNVLRGPFSVALAEDAAIGMRNSVRRFRGCVSPPSSRLRLGRLSKFTVGHTVDLICSVTLGDFTTVAGSGCQIWTHGYLHEPAGPGRVRIEGPVRLGNNVYVGSGSILTGGVSIADAVTVGSLSSVSKSLDRPGLYVSQPLRFIERDHAATLAGLEARPPDADQERVFRKRGAP